MKGWEYQSLKDTKTLLFFFLEIRASKGEFAVERALVVGLTRSRHYLASLFLATVQVLPGRKS